MVYEEIGTRKDRNSGGRGSSVEERGRGRGACLFFIALSLISLLLWHGERIQT
jgi:hypothetical protein